jgi:hypothetical protein
MNFSIRLGYHFSQVEAWVGDQLNDNYVRFFFKGGGAVRDRRLRRVRLISEILARLDFRVQVADDVVRAVAAKYRRAIWSARSRRWASSRPTPTAGHGDVQRLGHGLVPRRVRAGAPGRETA